jgi:hypothetical protein
MKLADSGSLVREVISQLKGSLSSSNSKRAAGGRFLVRAVEALGHVDGVQALRTYAWAVHDHPNGAPGYPEPVSLWSTEEEAMGDAIARHIRAEVERSTPSYPARNGNLVAVALSSAR